MTAAAQRFERALGTYGTRAVLADMIAWQGSHPEDAAAQSGSRRDLSMLTRYTADLDKRLLALAEGGTA